jgi:xylulokinase
MADGGPLEEVCQALPASHTFVPDAEQRALLLTRYARFRALYPALRALF